MDLIAGGAETLKSTTYFYTEFSQRELYEGQVPLEATQAALPNHGLIQRFQHDVLFELRGTKHEGRRRGPHRNTPLDETLPVQN